MTAPIWRSYDRAALDAQYNNRARVPAFPAYVERWQAAGAALRARLPHRYDIAYGSRDGERLNLFPAADPAAPWIVHFHGGYWQAMDKDDFDFMAPGALGIGAGFANVNYTLAPDATVAGIIDQCRQAIRFLHRELAAAGRPPRLYVVGNSAGGHLTAALALTDWAASGLAVPPIGGALAISGLYDLEPIRRTYLNDKLGLDAKAARAASPLYFPTRAGMPITLAVGEVESPEFHCQQDVFAAYLRGRGPEPTVITLPGADHFAAMDQLADPSGALIGALKRIIEGS